MCASTLKVRVISTGPKTANGHSRTLRVRILGTAKK
jgi:hypothetical protein